MFLAQFKYSNSLLISRIRADLVYNSTGTAPLRMPAYVVALQAFASHALGLSALITTPDKLPSSISLVAKRNNRGMPAVEQP